MEVETSGQNAADAVYAYDSQHIETLDQEKPWAAQPMYFKHVKISTLASMKMVPYIVQIFFRVLSAVFC